MKKITAILLALLLLLCAVSCVDPGEGKETTEDPESSVPPESSQIPDRIDLPYVFPMSEAMKYKIETEWYEYTGEFLVWFDENAETLNGNAIRYYGIFSDHIILFRHVGWDLDYGCSIKVAGYRFEHDELFEIYAYKNGKFYEIQSAYEKEFLTLPDIFIISEIHAKFEDYIKMYSEQ